MVFSNFIVCTYSLLLPDFLAVVVKEMSSFFCKLVGKEYNGKMV